MIKSPNTPPNKTENYKEITDAATEAEPTKKDPKNKKEIDPWEEDRIKMEDPATAGDPGFF